ncbi:polyamine transporter [Pelomyxa schiedti]|nr:polyamine transporter [Pelomyxa schiedti]
MSSGATPHNTYYDETQPLMQEPQAETPATVSSSITHNVGALRLSGGGEIQQVESPSTSRNATSSPPSAPGKSKAASSSSSSLGRRQTASLTWVALTGIVYFSVGGGPFGFEASLAASTPSIAFWGLLGMALLWALPQSMVVSEMATVMQFGYNQWVTTSLGEFYGFAHAFMRIMFSLFYNAIFADLFTTYFDAIVPLTTLTRIFVLLAFEFVVVGINMIGIRIVGTASFLLVIIVLSPFLSLFLMAAPQLNFSLLVTFPDGFDDIDMGLLISVLMFNLTGWDFVGNISSTAKKPMRDVPIALVGALTLVLLTYIVPLISSVSVLEPEKYSENLFTDAARALWPPFMWVINFSAFMGLLGLGVSFLSTSSEALAFSASYGYLPAWCTKRFTKRNVPWIMQITQGTSAFLICIPWGYDEVVQLQMFIFCMSTIVIMISYLVHRWRVKWNLAPGKKRTPTGGFQIPFPFWLVAILCLPTVALCAFAIVVAIPTAKLVGGITLALSLLFAFLWSFMRYGLRRTLHIATCGWLFKRKVKIGTRANRIQPARW